MLIHIDVLIYGRYYQFYICLDMLIFNNLFVCIVQFYGSIWAPGARAQAHHMVAATQGGCPHVVKGGRGPLAIMWSPIVLSALVQPFTKAFGHHRFFGFGPAMLFQLWLYCIVFQGNLETKIYVSSASQYR